MAHLLDEESPSPATIVPAGARATFTDPETGYQRQLYPAFEGGAIELVRHVVPAGVSSEALPSHAPGTEKYVVVEAGQLRRHVGDTSLDTGPATPCGTRPISPTASRTSARTPVCGC